MNMMIVTKFLRSCCPPVTVDEIRRTPVAEAPIGQGPVARALDSGRQRRPARSDSRLISASSGRVRPGTRTPSYVPNFTAYGGRCLKYEGDFACWANNQNPPTTVPILLDRMEPSSIKQCARPALVQEMEYKRPLPNPRAGRKSIGLITRPRS